MGITLPIRSVSQHDIKTSYNQPFNYFSEYPPNKKRVLSDSSVLQDSLPYSSSKSNGSSLTASLKV